MLYKTTVSACLLLFGWTSCCYDIYFPLLREEKRRKKENNIHQSLFKETDLLCGRVWWSTHTKSLVSEEEESDLTCFWTYMCVQWSSLRSSHCTLEACSIGPDKPQFIASSVLTIPIPSTLIYIYIYIWTHTHAHIASKAWVLCCPFEALGWPYWRGYTFSLCSAWPKSHNSCCFMSFEGSLFLSTSERVSWCYCSILL